MAEVTQVYLLIDELRRLILELQDRVRILEETVAGLV